ncbi:hypothetical protein JIN84_06195 [Luteolibacter yonseiensis]|uniref:Uncharacterized protein n=1 Tax=Luteolibacter yonseiensis TaxID=1144680 RepID=A0A934R4U0_9BACT|nr:hypothetical protein [Luteolibacter yonseiensis]MBK1815194.1 hypothetical protein [Luteolibacter yonseiensis]
MKIERYLEFWTDHLKETPPPKKPTAVYIAALLATAVVSLGVKEAPIEAYFFVTVPLSILAFLAMRKKS